MHCDFGHKVSPAVFLFKVLYYKNAECQVSIPSIPDVEISIETVLLDHAISGDACDLKRKAGGESCRVCEKESRGA